MSKIKRISICFLAMFIISNSSIIGIQILNASETIQGNFTTEEITAYDKYVVLEDEQYTLDRSAFSELSSSEVQKIEKQLESTNEQFDPEIYEEEAGVIVKTFKEPRGAGVTSIRIHWWGVHVKLSKNMFKTIARMSIASATTYIGIKFTLGAGAAAVIAGSVSLAESIVGNIKHGIQFKANWSGIVWYLSRQ